MQVSSIVNICFGDVNDGGRRDDYVRTVFFDIHIFHFSCLYVTQNISKNNSNNNVKFTAIGK